MKKYINKMNVVLSAIYILVVSTGIAHADPIEAALDAMQGWLTNVIGIGLLGIGGTILGIRMAAGDEHALEKAKNWFIGGFAIFLVKTLVKLMRQWTGQ